MKHIWVKALDQSKLSYLITHYHGEEITVHYVDLIGRIKSKVKIEPFFYGLGETQTSEGRALAYDVMEVACDFVQRMCTCLDLPSIESISGKTLNTEKVKLYFTKIFYTETYSILKLVLTVEEEILKFTGEHAIWCEEVDFSSIVNECFKHPKLNLKFFPRCNKGRMRSIVKSGIRAFLYMIIKLFSFKPKVSNYKNPTLAIRYVEGVDRSRRSDLFWYIDGRIKPSDILFYFEGNASVKIDKKAINSIEALGMNWVTLKWQRGMSLRTLCSFWKYKTKFQRSPYSSTIKPRWIRSKIVQLRVEVNYWESFYHEFNIKIHYDEDPTGTKNVAQSMAMDNVHGIRFSKQRSENVSYPSTEIGFYPYQIYFGWGVRTAEHLKANLNINKFMIVSGFSYNTVDNEKKAWANQMRNNLKKNGVKFIISLFDNTFSREYHYSSKLIENLYLPILEWASTDSEIGIIIKSKKSHIFEDLKQVKEKVDELVLVGRCLNLDDIIGRPPVDAALASDIAVGVGISSAVGEAIIHGIPGVHLDTTCQYKHAFYSVGKEQVIFDSVDKLMQSLKSYKANSNGIENLGLFKGFEDLLDPFMDGKGGERIGEYICGLLESLGGGASLSESIEKLNTKYCSIWGADKVINMESYKNPVEGKLKILGE